MGHRATLRWVDGLCVALLAVCVLVIPTEQRVESAPESRAIQSFRYEQQIGLGCQDLALDQAVTLTWPATSSPQTIRTDKGTLFERPRPDFDPWVHEEFAVWSLIHYQIQAQWKWLNVDGEERRDSGMFTSTTASLKFKAPRKALYCFTALPFGSYPEYKSASTTLDPPGKAQFRKAN